MNAVRQLAIIGGIALAAAGASWLIIGSPERAIDCNPEQLKADEICLESIPADAPVLWVDARSRKEWMTRRVPGSVLWNLDPKEDMQAFEEEVAIRIIETPQVVVYCGDESCGVSRQIAERIRALDLGAEVYVLHGGWEALKESGRVRAPNQNP